MKSKIYDAQSKMTLFKEILFFTIIFKFNLLLAAAEQPNLIELPKTSYSIEYKISDPDKIKATQLKWIMNSNGIPQLVSLFKYTGSFREISVKNKNSDEAKVFKKNASEMYDFYIESSAAEVLVDGVLFRIETVRVQNNLIIDSSCKKNKINFKVDLKKVPKDNNFVALFCSKDFETGIVSLFVSHQLDHDYLNSSLFETVGKGEAYKKYDLSSQIISQINSKIGFITWKSSGKVADIEIFVVENVFKTNTDLLKADIGLGINSFSLTQGESNSSKNNSIISYGDLSVSPFNLPSRLKINWYTQISDIKSSSNIPTQSSKTALGWDYYSLSDSYEFSIAAYMSFVNAYSFEISAFNTMQAYELNLTLATLALGRNSKLSLSTAYGFASGSDAKGSYIEVAPKYYFVFNKQTLFTSLLWSRAQFENASNQTKATAENMALIIGTTY